MAPELRDMMSIDYREDNMSEDNISGVENSQEVEHISLYEDNVEEETEDEENETRPQEEATYLPKNPAIPTDAKYFQLNILQLAKTMSLTKGGKGWFAFPGMQRPYEWSEQMATGLIEDLYEKFECKANRVVLQSINLWMKDENAQVINIVDGQQRIMTIFTMLSLLRNMADEDGPFRADTDEIFVFSTRMLKDGTWKEVEQKRLESDRCALQEFLEKYIVTNDVKAVDGLWDGEGKVKEWEIGGNSSLVRQLIRNINVMKKFLISPWKGNPSPCSIRGNIEAFGKYVLENVCLYAILAYGGGREYISQTFLRVNMYQKPLSVEDKLKAVMYEGAVRQKVDEADLANFTNKWEEVEEKLSQVYLPCALRNAFEELFHVIITIMIRSRATMTGVKKDLDVMFYFCPGHYRFVTNNPLRGQGLSDERLLTYNLVDNSANFMTEYFLPIASSMEKFLFWNELSIADLSNFPEMERKAESSLSRIQTSCRILSLVMQMKDRISMSSLIPTAVCLFHYYFPLAESIKDENQADQYIANLAMLEEYLHLLEIRFVNFLLTATHKNKIFNIMYGGGCVSANNKALNWAVKGILNQMCPATEGRGSLSLKLDDTQVMREIKKELQLRQEEINDENAGIFHKLLDLRYGKGSPLYRNVLLMIYDDQSRHPIKTLSARFELSNQINFYKFGIETVDNDHICPQAMRKRSRWSEMMNAGQFEACKNYPGNLCLLTSKDNKTVGNWEFNDKKEYFLKKARVQYLTTERVFNGRTSWTAENILRRDKEIFEHFCEYMGLDFYELENLSDGRWDIDAQSMERGEASTVSRGKRTRRTNS